MHTAICTFDDRAMAEQAVQRLVQAGFDRRDLHIQHRRADGSLMTEESEELWEGMEREVAVGYRVAETLGFFASLFGQDPAAGHTATYARAMERGSYVLVVDADNDAEAQRARAVLHGLQAGDLNVVHRAQQAPLRDIVTRRREPELEHAPGLRYADKD